MGKLIEIGIEVTGEIPDEDLLADNHDLDEVNAELTLGLEAVIDNVRQKFPHYIYKLVED